MPSHYRQNSRSIPDRFLLLFSTAFLLLPSPTRAEQGNELILTGSNSRTTSLIEFDYNANATAWSFVDATGELIESGTAAQLVRWGNPAKAKLAATLILHDGTTLITDRTWSASGYARVDGETVGLNRRDGWATVKRSEAEWLLLEAAMEGIAPSELLRSTADKQSKNDLIWLVGGDQIEGEILSLKSNSVSILLGKDSTPTDVPVSRVRAIRFASESGEKQQGHACLVGMEDGSLLVAHSVHISEQQATVKSVAGIHLKVDANAIVFLQPVARPLKAFSGQEGTKSPPASHRVVKYLSNREADDYRSTPYFDLARPYARDVSLDGMPLRAGGRIYAKGIAVHSAARLVYHLDTTTNEKSLRFQAELAIADSTPSIGSVEFRVYAIRDGKVEPLYRSPIVRGGDPPLPIDVDLTGATTLVLVVDYADNGDTGDQALWLDARLIGGS